VVEPPKQTFVVAANVDASNPFMPKQQSHNPFLAVGVAANQTSNPFLTGQTQSNALGFAFGQQP